MSLIITDSFDASMQAPDPAYHENRRDLDNLDRYLAIIEDNKNSCQFVPSDVSVALDMAGYVRGQLRGFPVKAPLSAARMALALVQPCATTQ